MVFLQPLLLLLVQNPIIPYLTSVPSNLKDGMVVRVKGFMLDHGRFVIDFHNGHLPEDDQPLHLSIRPNENVIVRNIFKDNQFGNEIRDGGCPIEYNSPFEILILVQKDKCKIAVNGKHFTDWSQQLPLSKTKYLRFRGNVKISTITFEDDFIVETSEPTETSMTNCVAPYSPYPFPKGQNATIPRD